MVGLAFEAALEEEAIPPEAEDRAVELAHDPDVPEGVRIRAVRVLGRLGTRAGRDVLMELVWKRKWWFWRRVAAKTPVVLEALAALARAWPGADAVRPVLEAAASSKDREIREAVDVKRETA
jgi:HEAT repeat protein